MVATAEAVTKWLDRMADGIQSAPRALGIEPMLLAYAAAAELAGFEDDLVQRIWTLAAEGEPVGFQAAAELRAIAAEARRRYPDGGAQRPV